MSLVDQAKQYRSDVTNVSSVTQEEVDLLLAVLDGDVSMTAACMAVRPEKRTARGLQTSYFYYWAVRVMKHAWATGAIVKGGDR